MTEEMVVAVACSSSRDEGEIDETRVAIIGRSEDGVIGSAVPPKMDGDEELNGESIAELVAPFGITILLLLIECKEWFPQLF